MPLVENSKAYLDYYIKLAFQSKQAIDILMAELQTLQTKVESNKVKIDVLEPTHNDSIVVENSVGESKDNFSDLISPNENTSKENSNIKQTFNDHDYYSQNDLAVQFYHPNDTKAIPDFTIQEFNQSEKEVKEMVIGNIEVKQNDQFCQDSNDFEDESEFEEEEKDESETQFEETENVDLTVTNPLLMCRNCDSLFASTEHLIEHMKIHEPVYTEIQHLEGTSDPNVPKVVIEFSKSEPLLEDQTIQSNPVEPEDLETLNDHKDQPIHINPIMPDTKSQQEDEEVPEGFEFECPICEKTFLDNESYLKHEKIHNLNFVKGKLYECPTCFKAFP